MIKKFFNWMKSLPPIGGNRKQELQNIVTRRNLEIERDRIQSWLFAEREEMLNAIGIVGLEDHIFKETIDTDVIVYRDVVIPCIFQSAVRVRSLTDDQPCWLAEVVFPVEACWAVDEWIRDSEPVRATFSAYAGYFSCSAIEHEIEDGTHTVSLELYEIGQERWQKAEGNQSQKRYTLPRGLTDRIDMNRALGRAELSHQSSLPLITWENLE